MQLAHWRWSWTMTLVTGAIAPLITVLGLAQLAASKDETTVQHLFVGSLILGLCFENQHRTAGHFSFQRETGAIGYFAALPIRQTAFIVATGMSFFLLSVPAMVLTTAVGAHILDLDLDPSPLLIIIVPAAVLPMSALGAMIGLFARNHSQSGAVSTALTMLTVVLGGVLVPSALLPDPIALVSNFIPIHYAASALQQTLLGPVTSRLWPDLAVLTTFSIMMFWLADRRLRREYW